MNNKTLIVVAIAVLIVGFVVGKSLNKQTNVSSSNGSIVGSVNCNTNTCLTGGFQADTITSAGTLSSDGALTSASTITSGGILSTTTSLSITLKQSDLGYSTISEVPIVGSITLTLPASSTLTSFIPNSGDRTYVTLVNATTTNAINLTIAGNTGTILTNSSTTAVIPAALKNGVLTNGVANLLFIRKPNTDVQVQLVPSI